MSHHLTSLGFGKDHAFLWNALFFFLMLPFQALLMNSALEKQLKCSPTLCYLRQPSQVAFNARVFIPVREDITLTQSSLYFWLG